MNDDRNMIDALAELAQQVRRGTLQLLHVPEASWLTWSPPGTSNHILWHGGHALWVQDVLCIQPLVGTSELPRGWADTFGQNCRPVSETTEWPSDDEVRAHLESQLHRILGLLVERAETIAINARESPPGGGWPLLAGMIHAWHDEARHQGEMYLLHKLCRARAAK
jgi:DinB superfamily